MFMDRGSVVTSTAGLLQDSLSVSVGASLRLFTGMGRAREISFMCGMRFKLVCWL